MDPTTKPIKSEVNTQDSPTSKPNVIVIKSYILTTKNAVKLLLNGTLKIKVCRYCLRITSPLSEMDQIMQVANKNSLYKVTIKDIVASFYPFKVADDPNMPNKICEKCLDKAVRSYLFAQQCEQSERALRNCFEDMYEKLNKLDPIEHMKKRGRQKQNPNHNVLFTENRNVIDYAEPIHHLINVSVTSLINEPTMGDLECKKCWQILPNVESLAYHEKIHPTSMWFNCRVCGKSFAKKIHMKRHLSMHARGKILTVTEKDSNFICKQCGHATENHNLHLQHIEKHKFQMVLEHLIERKMDKLCTVCFNNNSNMIEMDKMICLHGGYPELTGDRTLYNILGATIPEPNYKYQERYVPHMARIMKVTKKTENKVPEAMNDKFMFSIPNIISNEKNNYEGIPVFIFSTQEDIFATNMFGVKTSEFQIEPQANEEGFTKSATSVNVTEQIQIRIHEQSNIAEEKQIRIRDENKTEFSFSEPEYVIDVTTMTVETSKKDKNANRNEIVCPKCWIFKKPMCGYECIGNKDSQNKAKYNLMAMDESCKYCWIFKNTLACDFCKTSTVEIVKKIQENIFSDKTNEAITKPEAMLQEKATVDLNNLFVKEWQCKICLTTNNVDRETCICCQSEQFYSDVVKVNFPYKVDLMKNVSLNPDDTLNISQNDGMIDVMGTKPLEDQFIQQDETTDLMELTNSPPGIIDHTLTANQTMLEETMDIEENTLINNVYANIQVDKANKMNLVHEMFSRSTQNHTIL